MVHHNLENRRIGSVLNEHGSDWGLGEQVKRSLDCIEVCRVTWGRVALQGDVAAILGEDHLFKYIVHMHVDGAQRGVPLHQRMQRSTCNRFRTVAFQREHQHHVRKSAVRLQQLVNEHLLLHRSD